MSTPAVSMVTSVSFVFDGWSAAILMDFMLLSSDKRTKGYLKLERIAHYRMGMRKGNGHFHRRTPPGSVWLS